MSREDPLRLREVIGHLRGGWAIPVAVLPAAVPLALAALGLWSRDTGATIAVTLGVVFLCVWGLMLARRSRAPWQASLLMGAVSGLFGVVIVVLEIALH